MTARCWSSVTTPVSALTLMTKTVSPVPASARSVPSLPVIVVPSADRNRNTELPVAVSTSPLLALTTPIPSA